MRKLLVFVPLGVLLFTRIRRNPVLTLLGVLLFNRRVRGLTFRLLFKLIGNPQARRQIVNQIVRRLRFW